jgi:hypothetical protein
MKILGNIFIAVGVYLFASMFYLGIWSTLDMPTIVGLGFIGFAAIFSGIILRKTV